MNGAEKAASPVLCNRCFTPTHTGQCPEPPFPIPAFEDDPVAMALGFTPVKPGVVLPGTPEHCATCAAEWRLADYVMRAMALMEPDIADGPR